MLPAIGIYFPQNKALLPYSYTSNGYRKFCIQDSCGDVMAAKVSMGVRCKWKGGKKWHEVCQPYIYIDPKTEVS